MSKTSIVSVQELIDMAFYGSYDNRVNFKIMQTILMLLAHQLRLLGRLVEVDVDEVVKNYMDLNPNTMQSTISITEMKLRATNQQKVMKKQTKVHSSSSKTSASGKTRIGSIQLSKKKAEEAVDVESTHTLQVKEETSWTKSLERVSAHSTGTLKPKAEELAVSKQAKASEKQKDTAKPKGKKGVSNVKEEIGKTEMERERQLRIISQFSQRKDSRVEPAEKPPAMTPLDAKEEELLLIVSKTHRNQKGKGPKGYDEQLMAPPGPKRRLSVVTQSEFELLKAAVMDLQRKHAPWTFGSSDFPENQELLEQLKNGASLSDAMAALQLSARLEAAEKALSNMTEMVASVIAQEGLHKPTAADYSKSQSQAQIKKQSQAYGQIQSQGPFQDQGQTQGQVQDLARGQSLGPIQEQMQSLSHSRNQSLSQTQARGKSQGQIRDPSQGKILTHTQSQGKIQSKQSQSQTQVSRHHSQGKGLNQNQPQVSTPLTKPGEKPVVQYIVEDEPVDFVTYTTFKNTFNDLREELKAQFGYSNEDNSNSAQKILKTHQNIGAQIENCLKLEDRMVALEENINSYLQRINQLDSEVTLQLTSYQEALMQMQIDMELGLEAMAEKLAHPMGDPGGISDLNEKFNGMQHHLEVSFATYDVFQANLAQYGIDIEELWKKMDILRDTKSDRDEMIEGLHDKVSLGMLNGFVRKDHYDAVKADLEKQISMSYDKFNHQELYWQKAIEELVKKLNDKTDTKHVRALRDDINDHLNRLKMRMDFIYAIVGDPKAFATTKRISHAKECLSCATPALMAEQAKGGNMAALRARGAVEANDDDDALCYPGLKVPHRVDPRSHLCNRYCGGSHTRIPPNAKTHMGRDRLPDLIVKTVERAPHLEQGTDGKSYKTDAPLKPCQPCNSPCAHARSRPDSPSTILPPDEQEDNKIDPLSMNSFSLEKSQDSNFNFNSVSREYDSVNSF